MASSLLAAALAVLAAVSAVQPAHGRLACEELPPDVCASAVSSGGRRCVLEHTPEGAPRCQTAAAAGARLAGAGWAEADACVRACGLDRAALGLRALCSAACQAGCPNVVDLYATAAAAAEGMSLPAMCEAAREEAAGGRRMMMEGMAPLGAPVGAPVAAMAPM